MSKDLRFSGSTFQDNLTPPLPTEPQVMHETREQIEKFIQDARVRIDKEYENDDVTYECITDIHQVFNSCLQHISDLEARLKPVTESELRAMFEQPRLEKMRRHTPLPDLPRRADGSYLFDETNVAWYWFLEAARLFGKVAQ
jgi:hypothetical protein